MHCESEVSSRDRDRLISLTASSVASGSPGEFVGVGSSGSGSGSVSGAGTGTGTGKNKSQDVASKSLSGLESLVDQIPSIAEGGGGGVGGGAGVPGGSLGPSPEAAPATAAPLPEPYPALYGYGYGGAAAAYNNSYAPPFVGYSGGWGGQLMRPTPGYLGEAAAAWQYQYGAGSYPPHNYAPYYNGYQHQQYLSHATHHLSLDLHKNAEASVATVPPVAPVPPVPSVPSVGFGGFC